MPKQEVKLEFMSLDEFKKVMALQNERRAQAEAEAAFSELVNGMTPRQPVGVGERVTARFMRWLKGQVGR